MGTPSGATPIVCPLAGIGRIPLWAEFAAPPGHPCVRPFSFAGLSRSTGTADGELQPIGQLPVIVRADGPLLAAVLRYG